MGAVSVLAVLRQVSIASASGQQPTPVVIALPIGAWNHLISH